MTYASLLFCALVALWLRSDLKKQSQFVKGQNDAKSVQAKVYGNLDGWMRRENKANSKPICRPLAGNTKL